MSLHRDIAAKIDNNNAELWYVGGTVRDELMGVPQKDFDFVVFGMDGIAKLQSVLSEFGDAVIAGTEFPVVKLRVGGDEMDFALARRELSTGDGYHDVTFSVDGVTMRDDAIRRDLTVNAIYKNVLTGTIESPVGGIDDLNNKVLRHTSSKFTESSERPLRIAQFVARYPTFCVDDGTVQICRNMSDKFRSIPKEQLRQQFYKMLTGEKPSAGLRFLVDIGWINKFPALADMIGLVQDASHHPEGDVFTHTMMVVDEMAQACDSANITGMQRFKLVLAALVHDTGKVGTTKWHNGKIVSYGHQENLHAAHVFLSQIGVPSRVINAVLVLARHHMSARNEPTVKSVRRLSRKLWNAVRTDNPDYSAGIGELCMLMTADVTGRGVANTTAIKRIEAILDFAAREHVVASKPPRVVTGYDIMDAFGLTKRDGLLIGKFINAAQSAADDGLVVNKREAIAFLAEKYKLEVVNGQQDL